MSQIKRCFGVFSKVGDHLVTTYPAVPRAFSGRAVKDETIPPRVIREPGQIRITRIRRPRPQPAWEERSVR